MKDKLQITRKQLKALATQLGAQNIATNIYNYENNLYDLCKVLSVNKVDYCSEIIAYSAGLYGNNGRIDKIHNNDEDRTIFVCWY